MNPRRFEFEFRGIAPKISLKIDSEYSFEGFKIILTFWPSSIDKIHPWNNKLQSEALFELFYGIKNCLRYSKFFYGIEDVSYTKAKQVMLMGGGAIQSVPFVMKVI